MHKKFYTYINQNDPYLKYQSDNTYTGVFNDCPGMEVLGEVAAYDKILAEAKLMGYDPICTAQKRRHLVMPQYIDPDKVYHSWFYVRGNNLSLWEQMHPQAKDLLMNACIVLLQKYPQYKDAVNFVLTSNIIFPHNMFCMNRERFEQYNNWLRSIFCRLNLPPEPAKVGSLLAERLFTIWVFHNFGIKDTVWVPAKAYDKITGKELECLNGVAD